MSKLSKFILFHEEEEDEDLYRNLADGLSYEDERYYNDSGSIAVSDGTKLELAYIAVVPARTYEIDFTGTSTYKIRVHEYDADKGWLRQIVSGSGAPKEWRASNDAKYIRFSLPIVAEGISIRRKK